ncbi:MAG TPA: acyl-CoA dehydrogenase family protein [Pseudonocardia sp.]
METIKAPAPPTRVELTQRAADLVPLLRANAPWQEENRRLHDETVEALGRAGILKMRLPARLGGYAADSVTQLDVSIELGRGDGSAAFDTVAWWVASWILGLFPDEVQDEVFASPDVLVCATLAPTGTATVVGGGLRVSGKWSFNSGAAHSSWKLLSAMLPAPDGGSVAPIIAVVPMKELQVIDDWHVAGLRGTGSVTTAVDDLFVPASRYLPISSLLRAEPASRHNAGSPRYSGPGIGHISAAEPGKLIGLAMAAKEAFLERMEMRGIANTSYSRQADAPVTHLQLAEASLQIDEAGYHGRRLAELVDAKSAVDEPWTMQERAYARVAVGRVCQLAHGAVTTLAQASGAGSLYTGAPIQRIQRDVQAIALHALHVPTTNLELYGRVLSGLEPNTVLV